LLKNHHKADEFAKHADFVIENIAGLLKIIDGKKENSPPSSQRPQRKKGF
jgi:hypothetical protein